MAPLGRSGLTASRAGLSTAPPAGVVVGTRGTAARAYRLTETPA